jgi:hypothetical protein
MNHESYRKRCNLQKYAVTITKTKNKETVEGDGEIKKKARYRVRTLSTSRPLRHTKKTPP